MSYGDALLQFAEASASDLGQLLTVASANINQALFVQLADRGHTVRPAHVPVFACLDPDGTSISTIAARAGISRQAMSALVKDLEAEGYVRTSPDPVDRRAVVVELDKRGAEFCRTAAALASASSAAWRATLGDESYDAMIEAVRAVGSA